LCLAVFIASDQPPVLVPWDETAPAFNVVPVSEHEQIVRQQFSLVHTVYAGAHTGCSCGFRDDKDPAAAARSRLALLQYIERTAATSPVEVFVCWEGDWARLPSIRAERSLTSLRSDFDWLEELTFTRIT
jgi:hypothetical protein